MTGFFVRLVLGGARAGASGGVVAKPDVYQQVLVCNNFVPTTCWYEVGTNQQLLVHTNIYWYEVGTYQHLLVRSWYIPTTVGTFPCCVAGVARLLLAASVRLLGGSKSRAIPSRSRSLAARGISGWGLGGVLGQKMFGNKMLAQLILEGSFFVSMLVRKI